MLRVISILVFVLNASAVIGQTTHQVPSGHATIQGAIAAAQSGDVIEVAPGTYFETDISFLGKDVSVRGVAGALETIIDAQSSGRCFLLTQGETSAAQIEGFTLLHAQAPNGAQAPLRGEDGGGILCVGSSPVISGCIFFRCVAGGGGATNIFIPSPNPGGDGGNGGGIACGLGAPRIENCAFIECRAGRGGDGFFAIFGPGLPTGEGGSGGGISGQGSAVVVGCTFFRNEVHAPCYGSPDASGTPNGSPGIGPAIFGNAVVSSVIAWKNLVNGDLVPPQVVTQPIVGASVSNSLVNIDPRFQNEDSGPGFPDTRLLPDSPAIGIGDASSYTSAVDLLGAPRSFYGAPDVGCCEFISSATAGATLDGSGMLIRPLSIDGAVGPLFNGAVGVPFFIELAQPPGRHSPSGFGIWGQVGPLSLNDEFETVLGSLCFPLALAAPSNPSLFRLVDSSVGPSTALFSASRGSLTLAIPGLPFAGAFTIQGLVEHNDAPFPTSLARTNAIHVIISP